jgi:hypothetical protein
MLGNDTVYSIPRGGTMVRLIDEMGRIIDSTYLSRPRLPAPLSGGWPTAILSGRRVVFRTTAPLVRSGSDEAGARPLLLINTEGAILDTLVSITPEHVALVATFEGGVQTIRVQPFRDDPLVEVDPQAERVVIVRRSVDGSNSYSLTARSLDGDTVFVREVAYDPIPFRPDWAIDWIRTHDPETAESEGRLARWREALFVPPALPPVTDLLLGRDGSVWLRRETHPEEPALTWEIWSRDGSAAGAFELPRDLSLRAAGAGFAWATKRGHEEGVYQLFHILVEPSE